MARILVIDDTKNILKMIKLALTQRGHEIHTAENGLQGLELFGDGEGWDLVLLDQRMPGLEGRELTHEMHQRAPHARLVMMTSFPSLELASDVISAGALDFLRKPLTREMLQGAVEVALQRPVAVSPSPGAATETTRDPSLNGLPPRPAGLPPVTFYLNGFTFWPVQLLESERESVQHLPAYAVFQICGPSQERGRCVVGVTPHVAQQVLAQARPSMVDDFLWEVLCREPLTHYLWEHASLPPMLLPIYELSANQFDYIRRLNNAGDEF